MKNFLSNCKNILIKMGKFISKEFHSYCEREYKFYQDKYNYTHSKK